MGTDLYWLVSLHLQHGAWCPHLVPGLHWWPWWHVTGAPHQSVISFTFIPIRCMIMWHSFFCHSIFSLSYKDIQQEPGEMFSSCHEWNNIFSWKNLSIQLFYQCFAKKPKKMIIGNWVWRIWVCHPSSYIIGTWCRTPVQGELWCGTTWSKILLY